MRKVRTVYILKKDNAFVYSKLGYIYHSNYAVGIQVLFEVICFLKLQVTWMRRDPWFGQEEDLTKLCGLGNKPSTLPANITHNTSL